MKMHRRDLLKTLGSTTVAATLSGVLSGAAPAQVAPRDRDGPRAPERLLESEPELMLSPEGEVTVQWQTVVPTQGATIYLGLPNDEIALDWPIYSSNQAVLEDSPRLQHKATLDRRAYLGRFAARKLLSGGVVAYRLELLDPRKPLRFGR